MQRIISALMFITPIVGCESDEHLPAFPNRQETKQKEAAVNHFKIARPKTDDTLDWDVLQIIWKHADFYADEETYNRSIQPATKGQLAIYACTWYLSEVNNGGHDQFFFNSTGMVWQDALAGFELVGANKHHKILTEAVKCFPEAAPAKDRQTRSEQMDEIKEGVFDELDDRLYARDEIHS